MFKKCFLFSSKRVCAKRSGFFGCTNTYSGAFYRCAFPSEVEMARKSDKILENLVNMICTNVENDSSIIGASGQQCLVSSQVEIMTCANKSIYSVVKRLLEKWIENEHFAFEMEAEDCK